ncbi:MAG TPA: four helix bundle protein [Dehalococcoidia bacterium]|nr:four helix bundle protein [Dehalococcoidia bacterium]
MRDFRQLAVWNKSHLLTLDVYRATASFPQSEQYSLTSQIRRSSSSIPSNIAEGCGRDGNAELTRFIHIAMGSASELEYQLLLAHELFYLNDGDFDKLAGQVVEVKKMLTGFVGRLKAER